MSHRDRALWAATLCLGAVAAALAFWSGTEVADPFAGSPLAVTVVLDYAAPAPSPTPPPSCPTAPGTACWAPTNPPGIALLPTWPGAANDTPGRAYVMGVEDDG